MSCKLYIRAGGRDWFMGEYPNRKRAEMVWGLSKEKLRNEMGSDVQPIYVETGKGRTSK